MTPAGLLSITSFDAKLEDKRTLGPCREP